MATHGESIGSDTPERMAEDIVAPKTPVDGRFSQDDQAYTSYQARTHWKFRLQVDLN